MIEKITFCKVTKEYEDEYAVVDFSLSIDNGEFLVLVGPSGSGKSSILKML